jgi:protein-S-isoprenylcysteine O-methyltransferase Ste14
MTKPLPFVWPYWLIFWVVYVWAFIPEFGIVRRAPVMKAGPAEDRGSLKVVLLFSSLAFYISFVIAFAVPRARFPGSPILWFWIGLATLVAGSLLRRHCFRVLGRFFTGAVTIQSDHRVVDSGAYRWVRHPSYSAAMLMVVGVALALDTWLGVLVGLALAAVGYSYRAHVEEQALLAKLGEPYARFLASRKRFVPFLW